MNEFGLLSICLTAFAAVFVLLSFLAAVMHLIIRVFPEKDAVRPESAEDTDPSVVAAITGTAAAVYPGARVTKIEVKK